MSLVIYVIPDTQSKEGVKNPLIPVARHIAVIRPDIILHGGDHWDMPSLSQYDKGKKSHRTKTYRKDITAGNKSMYEFFDLLDKLWPEHKVACKKVILKGNHEYRIDRAREYGPDELIDLMDLIKPDYTGWDEVHEFLEIVKFGGIYFSHYFQQDKTAHPISSARMLLSKRHRSMIAFHSQGFDYCESLDVEGQPIQALIVGACYYHDEAYKNQTNAHFRGSVVLYNVDNGNYDFSRHSLDSLDKVFC